MSNVGGLNTEDLMMDFNKTLVAGSTRRFMGQIGAKSRDLWQVDIKDLRVMEGFNVRVRNRSFHEHVASLASSMKSEGFYQQHALAGFVAIEGDEQVIYVTDGHCRLEAIHLANAQGAEIKTVPVVVSANSDLQDLTVGLVRGNSGKNLEPFELAVVAKRLAKWGWPQKEIAQRMGVSVTTVQNYLALMQAPREIRDMVAEGTVGLHTALESLRTRGADAVPALRQAAEGSDKGGNGTRKSVERRDVVAPSFGSTIKKAAPRMFAAINDLRADTGYKSLSDDTRKKIDDLVSELEELRRKANQGLSKTGDGGTEGSGNATEAKTEAVATETAEASEQVAA